MNSKTFESPSDTPTSGDAVRKALPPTQEYFLRAMAENYAGGHSWDHLDADTCTMAADEIKALRAALKPEAAPAGEVVTLTYTNYRGETSARRIIPKSVRYGSTEWHPEPQWLLLAWDDDKQADREFALKDFATPAPVAEVREALACIDDLIAGIKREHERPFSGYAISAIEALEKVRSALNVKGAAV